MLQDRLARTERAGHAERAALGHRQERVHAAQLGHQRLVGAQTLLIAADGLLYRPGEHHGQLLLLAVFVFNHRHGVPDVVYALFPDRLHHPLALHTERHHDQVGEQPLRNAAHRVACGDPVTGLHQGGKLPVPVGNRIEIHAALQEEAALLCQIRQGVLQAVEHLGQQARPQLHAHQLAGQLHLVAHLDAVGHLIDLHTGRVAVDADDLALEPVIAHQDIAHFIFAHRAGKAGGHQVSVYTCHISCYFVHIVFLLFRYRLETCCWMWAISPSKDRLPAS